ncbi:hypothetical protein H6P81_014018 [Aristolochia fimbriata]|uniref:Uncharacterized protein n=1 Tax=Aristolochia fimbriata TaxID=158543 RepID=A0AAV7EGA8_ARIFI|nr:hypothetical protein H6P81_014018 [Aristolochia fimbriata]
MEGEYPKCCRRKRSSVLVDLMEFLEAKRLKQEEEEPKLPKRRPDADLLEALTRSSDEDFTEPQWLGSKKMTKTDVDPHHHRRFFIPRTAIQRLKPHLRASEKSETEPLDAPGISVSVVGPLGNPEGAQAEAVVEPQPVGSHQGLAAPRGGRPSRHLGLPAWPPPPTRPPPPKNSSLGPYVSTFRFYTFLSTLVVHTQCILYCFFPVDK